MTWTLSRFLLLHLEPHPLFYNHAISYKSKKILKQFKIISQTLQITDIYLSLLKYHLLRNEWNNCLYCWVLWSLVVFDLDNDLNYVNIVLYVWLFFFSICFLYFCFSQVGTNSLHILVHLLMSQKLCFILGDTRTTKIREYCAQL